MAGTSRRRLGAAAATALIWAAGLAGCGGAKHVAPPQQSLGQSFDTPLPSTIANIPLTTADGTRTSLAAYRGKAVMIADFLTLCTDICPMISANAVAMARALDAEGQSSQVALLEITVDPHRDTPARLRAYQKLYGSPVSNWTLLRASPADTAKLWKFFGVQYSRAKEPNPPDVDWLTHKPLRYDVSHLDALIFLDADGHERFVVEGSPNVQGSPPPKPLLHSLSAQGVNSIRHPDPVTDWTVSQGLSVFSWLLDKPLAAPSP